jgi:hypothetical protein
MEENEQMKKKILELEKKLESRVDPDEHKKLLKQHKKLQSLLETMQKTLSDALSKESSNV